MPVYRDNLDNIVGIVFVKDLVALPPGAEPPLTTLMRSAYLVPESKRVSELLKEMQRRQAADGDRRRRIRRHGRAS